MHVLFADDLNASRSSLPPPASAAGVSPVRDVLVQVLYGDSSAKLVATPDSGKKSKPRSVNIRTKKILLHSFLICVSNHASMSVYMCTAPCCPRRLLTVSTK